MSRPIPDEVRRFILTSIPSVPYLEAMLQLRAEPGMSWDGPSLSRRLYLPQQRTTELLQQLAEAGFAAADDNGWSWQPGPEARERIDALAAAYSDNLLGVTELIHSREDRRARQFADAFRWRKDDKDKEE
jgi:DNA-binding IclR family transcriptional regulator